MLVCAAPLKILNVRSNDLGSLFCLWLLKHCRGLQVLSIGNNQLMTDESIKHISQLPCVKVTSLLCFFFLCLFTIQQTGA
jgi:hypothetical protein